ncbi:hypothetical protein TVAG_435860 [Trichomonas vaginalis G3]|uniref:Uncharacterized protein n=1 Tax=Trichomonas vaginalis (strain ATCC PRA-98 / G3) TaxID=412133 RepID=A2FB58_TRIV3|nr:Ankyrin repeat family [Trichomonas vaginalis G3]EAX97839.1 hypothetical protein TVAG_435860 [Trichomonas vaginalis G3]KAI5541811.1 Ankyrin repeat family [Trichomonas vaginalis G3]|eukprot:XP_001310769.1 hypothetical protein [Trichomonas vaginalis G3]
MTALHYALIDINAKSKMRRTFFQHAVLHSSTKAAKILLSNGAEINAKSNDGMNELHIAA